MVYYFLYRTVGDLLHRLHQFAKIRRLAPTPARNISHPKIRKLTEISATGFFVCLFLVGFFASRSVFIYFENIYQAKMLADSVSTQDEMASNEGVSLANNDPATMPTRLIIPKINVNASLEKIGLTSAGSIAVPAGPRDAGWFDLGPQPGQSGNAIIVGHEGWLDQVPAVFDGLHSLKAGDTIYVETAAKKILTFKVQSTQTYDRTADISFLYKNNGGKHITLITCSGDWDATLDTYDKRLIISADLTS